MVIAGKPGAAVRKTRDTSALHLALLIKTTRINLMKGRELQRFATDGLARQVFVRTKKAREGGYSKKCRLGGWTTVLSVCMVQDSKSTRLSENATSVIWKMECTLLAKIMMVMRPWSSDLFTSYYLA
ncbi:uncharacterized protein LOC104584692 isoform X2 [Brachypodium distachyon]|uniref:uncharacterized protein LOC104584692 isoform X2 n=1 Tax=Brachypodium distachyon TaxID=15368 RepID=UPI00052FEE35|nr:uncharacterized protein LOC104584692 isoform X2 [Brachypodium distachyon]|eukprot:XP_010238256.1 uncharacterized protein LOC104584692 isoform X2 [Brachypodium distachyon]